MQSDLDQHQTVDEHQTLDEHQTVDEPCNEFDFSEGLGAFFEPGAALEDIELHIAAPDQPLELLEKLGPSPFPRSGFPLIGFLATTYDQGSRYALGEEDRRR